MALLLNKRLIFTRKTLFLSYQGRSALIFAPDTICMKKNSNYLILKYIKDNQVQVPGMDGFKAVYSHFSDFLSEMERQKLQLSER